MTDRQFAELLDALTIQTALLLEIREALVGAQTPEPVASTDPAVCEHPDERRVDVSTMNDRGAWICAVCKYEYHALIQH